MQGRRLPDGGHPLMSEGDYWRDDDGMWWVRPPNSGAGTIEDHEVTEHEDGTITVEPSIDAGTWHGFLRRGTWST